jgi:hypothetical protein
MYNLASLIIIFGVVFIFFYTPYILFELSISLFGRIYMCNVTNWILILFFFYDNCMDILMNLERALCFSNGFQKIKQISAYLICFIVLIICIIIHIPSDLAMTYTPDYELYIKLNLCHSTSFATKTITKMILIISYIIEGPIVRSSYFSNSNFFVYWTYS